MKIDERFIIYGSFAFVGAAVAVVAVAEGRFLTKVQPPRAAVAETVITESFPSISPKADKIVAHPDFDSTKIVKTVAVVPLWRPEVSNPRFEPLPAPVIAQTEFPSLPKPKADKPERASDVCTRHGGHRETTPGKRGGWHCAYPKKS